MPESRKPYLTPSLSQRELTPASFAGMYDVESPGDQPSTLGSNGGFSVLKI